MLLVIMTIMITIVVIIATQLFLYLT